ncbi:MAG TPA: O-antigen ligase family protein [Kofleriaceae bacterium]|nr:O-antigen ligase family protein [Kofleriaceae bacterium]
MSGAASDLRVVGLQALVASIALIALAWIPPMPVAGAQLSDAIGAAGVGLVLLLVRPRVGWVVAAMAIYVALAAVSCMVMHGSFAKLGGVAWLVMLALGVAAACEDPAVEARIRKALVVAALVGAVTGLVGAVLFFVGVKTGLLNHAGDLVPGNYPRIRGTMMRANALAGLIGTGLLLVGDLDARWRRPAYAVLLVALVFTFSRTWIALAGTVAVTHVAFVRRRDVLALAAAVLTVAVMLLVSWPTLQLDPSHPWRISFSGEPGTRLVHLRDALDTIRAHPLLGVGPGHAAAAGGWDAHFTLANVAAVVGIPAALAFLAILVGAGREVWKRARAGDLASRALASIFILYAFDALARDVEDQRALWIVVGLALARFSSRR